MTYPRSTIISKGLTTRANSEQLEFHSDPAKYLSLAAAIRDTQILRKAKKSPTSLFLRGQGANLILFYLTQCDSFKLSQNISWSFNGPLYTERAFFSSILEQLKQWTHDLYHDDEKHEILKRLNLLSDQAVTNYEQLITLLGEFSNKKQLELAFPSFSFLPTIAKKFIEKLLQSQQYHNIFILLADNTTAKKDHQTEVVYKQHTALQIAQPENILVNTSEHMQIKDENSINAIWEAITQNNSSLNRDPIIKENLAQMEPQATILGILSKIFPYSFDITWLDILGSQYEIYTDKGHKVSRTEILQVIQNLEQQSVVTIQDNQVSFHRPELKDTFNEKAKTLHVEHLAEYIINIISEDHPLYSQLILNKKFLDEKEVNFLERSIGLWSQDGAFENINLAINLLLKYFSKLSTAKEYATQKKITDLWSIKLRYATDSNVNLVMKEAKTRFESSEFKTIPADLQITFYTSIVNICGTFANSLDGIDGKKIVLAVQALSPAAIRVPDDTSKKDLFIASRKKTCIRLAKAVNILNAQYQIICQYRTTTLKSSIAKYINDKIEQDFPNEFRDMVFYKMVKQLNLDDALLKECTTKKKKAIDKFYTTITPQLRLEFAIAEFHREALLLSYLTEDTIKSLRLMQKLARYMLKRRLFCPNLLIQLSGILMIESGGLMRNITLTQVLFDTLEKVRKQFPEDCLLSFVLYTCFARYYNLDKNLIDRILSTAEVAKKQSNFITASMLSYVAMRYSEYAYSDDLKERFALKYKIITSNLSYFLNFSAFLPQVLVLISSIRPDQAQLGLKDKPLYSSIIEEIFLDKYNQIESTEREGLLKTILTEKQLTYCYKGRENELDCYAKLKVILRIMKFRIAIADAMLNEMLMCIVTDEIDEGIEIALLFVMNNFMGGFEGRLTEANAIMAITILTALKYRRTQDIPTEIYKFLFKSSFPRIVNHLASAQIRPVSADHRASVITATTLEAKIYAETVRMTLEALKKGPKRALEMARQIEEKYLRNPSAIPNALGLAQFLMVAAQIGKKIQPNRRLLALGACNLYNRIQAQPMALKLLKKDRTLDSFSLAVTNIKDFLINGSQIKEEVIASGFISPDLLESLSNLYQSRKMFFTNEKSNNLHEGSTTSTSLTRLIELAGSGYKEGIVYSTTEEVSLFEKKYLLENTLSLLLEELFTLLADEFNFTYLATRPQLMVLMFENKKWYRLARNAFPVCTADVQEVGVGEIPISVLENTPPYSLITHKDPKNLFLGEEYYNPLLRISNEGIMTFSLGKFNLVLESDFSSLPNIDLQKFQEKVTPLRFASLEILLEDITLISNQMAEEKSFIENDKTIGELISETPLKRSYEFDRIDLRDTIRLHGAFDFLRDCSTKGTLLTENIQSALNLINKFKIECPQFWSNMRKILSENQLVWSAPITQLLNVNSPSKKLKLQARKILDNLQILASAQLLDPRLLSIKHLEDYAKLDLNLFLFIELHYFMNEFSKGNFERITSIKDYAFKTDLGRRCVLSSIAENLMFYLAIEFCVFSFQSDLIDDLQMRKNINIIVEAFVKTGAETISPFDKISDEYPPANLDHTRRNKIIDSIELGNETSAILNELVIAQLHVKNLLALNLKFNPEAKSNQRQKSIIR